MKIISINNINLEDNKIIIEIVKTVIKLIKNCFYFKTNYTKKINIIKAVLDKPVGLGFHKIVKTIYVYFPPNCIKISA